MSLIKEEKGTFRVTNFVPLTTIVVMVNEKQKYMYIHLSRGKKHSICTESLESKKIWDSLLSSPNRVSVLFQKNFFIIFDRQEREYCSKNFYKIMLQEEIYIYGDLLVVKLLIIFPFTHRERFSLQDFTPLERLWLQQDLID